MTSMEIANAHLPIGSPTRFIAELAEAIDEALADERERCAKAMDAMAAACDAMHTKGDQRAIERMHAYERAATTIRSLA